MQPLPEENERQEERVIVAYLCSLRSISRHQLVILRNIASTFLLLICSALRLFFFSFVLLFFRLFSFRFRFLSSFCSLTVFLFFATTAKQQNNKTTKRNTSGS